MFKEMMGFLWSISATIFPLLLKLMKRSNMVQGSKKKSKSVYGSVLSDPKFIKSRQLKLWLFQRAGLNNTYKDEKIFGEFWFDLDLWRRNFQAGIEHFI